MHEEFALVLQFLEEENYSPEALELVLYYVENDENNDKPPKS